MNSETSLRKRLMGMLPASDLKALRQFKGTKHELIQQLATALTTQQAWELAFQLFPLLKQHTYLYTHPLTANPAIVGSVISSANFVRQENVGAAILLDHIHEVTYDIMALDIANGVVRGQQLKFYVPIRVHIEPQRMFVSMVILEKDLASHLGDGWRVITSQRNRDEKAILAEVIAGVPAALIPSPLNFDKGVKKLWDDGLIDTPFITIKNSDSTRTESMDSNTLFKDKYPQEYARIVSKPLLETLFVPTDEKSTDLPRAFKVAPMKGEISFTLYQPSTEAISNVLNGILTNN